MRQTLCIGKSWKHHEALTATLVPGNILRTSLCRREQYLGRIRYVMDCRGGETSASCISHQDKKCKAKVGEAVEAHPSYRRRASMQLLKASPRAAIPSTSADESGPDALKVTRLRFSICNESDRFVSPFAETVGSYLGFEGRLSSQLTPGSGSSSAPATGFLIYLSQGLTTAPW